MSLRDKIQIIPRKLIKDERGWFYKAITGKEGNIPTHTGEVYLTMGKPGQTKGGHYHPLAVEWFTVIEGEAILKLEDVSTHEKMQISMMIRMVSATSGYRLGLINGIRMIVRSAIGGAIVMIRRPSILALGGVSTSEPSS